MRQIENHSDLQYIVNKYLGDFYIGVYNMDRGFTWYSPARLSWNRSSTDCGRHQRYMSAGRRMTRGVLLYGI